MNSLDNVSALLETYRGHDQVLSLIGYGSKMLSGFCACNQRPKACETFKIISTQISNARVILRLLDDASMLSYTLKYGLGKHVSISQAK